MTSEKLFRAMRDIDPQLITDAAPDERTPKKSSRAWIKWASIAACLALVIMCVPALVHIFDPSGVDDPAYGAEHRFDSYAELCGVLPSGSILANIPNSEAATITSYAVLRDVQPDDGAELNDHRNFSYLNVDVTYPDGTGVNIFCTFRSGKTAKEHVNGHPLTYPPQSTSVTTVCGYEVYCAEHWVEHEGGKVQALTAVLAIDDTLYELTSDTLSRDALTALVGDMIAGG